MANPKKSVPENKESQYYVDSTCINCGACRALAPSIFGDTGDTAFVKKKAVEKEIEHSQEALVSCPVGSIGKFDKTPLPVDLPRKIEEGIYINGYTSENSYGAMSYSCTDPSGNWMIDSPKFQKPLVKKFHKMGGIKTIFLTHKDDVCDAELYAQEFGSNIIIHNTEASACPSAQTLLSGEGDWDYPPGKIIFTPGHTEGHCVLLWKDKYLFTGDHYAYIYRLGRIGSYKNACWYSWDEQIKSVEKLKKYKNVTWLLPGHGGLYHYAKNEFSKTIEESIAHMRN